MLGCTFWCLFDGLVCLLSGLGFLGIEVLKVGESVI